MRAPFRAETPACLPRPSCLHALPSRPPRRARRPPGASDHHERLPSSASPRPALRQPTELTREKAGRRTARVQGGLRPGRASARSPAAQAGRHGQGADQPRTKALSAWQCLPACLPCLASKGQRSPTSARAITITLPREALVKRAEGGGPGPVGLARGQSARHRKPEPWVPPASTYSTGF